jgi:transposase
MTLVMADRVGAVPMSGYDQEKRYSVVAEVRRKWTDAEKQAILAEAKEGSVSAVARKHGVAANLVFRWRQ